MFFVVLSGEINGEEEKEEQEGGKAGSEHVDPKKGLKSSSKSK